MFDDKLADGSFLGKIFPCHREQWEVDIRIEIGLIRMAMMSIMLLHPPPMAHAKEQIAADQPNDVILPGGTRDLSMSSIVTKQPKLCGNKGQVGGIEELEPQRVDRDQQDDA